MLKPVISTVENVVRYVLACTTLHNYLFQTSSASYCPKGFVDCEDSSCYIKPGEWRSGIGSTCLDKLNALRGKRNADEPIRIRNALADYMLSDEGKVPWQLDYIRRVSSG